MKILIIVWNFYPNTAYYNRTKATVKGFREAGETADVLSLKPLKNEEKFVVNNKFIGVGSFSLTLLGTIYGFILLIFSIRKYDIVYCSTGTLLVNQLSYSLARIYNKKIVHERTEFPDIFYSKNAKGNKTQKKYCKCISKYDHVFVISEGIMNYFNENGVDKKKISIFPMIVDPDRFENIIKTSKDEKYITYCGNMQNSKDGITDLLSAYGQSQIDRETYKLMLIGNCPSQEERNEYKKIIANYHIEDKVIFTGTVSQNEMPQLLTDSDVLVLCRPDNRQAKGGFPTKLGEYLSSGNPVLITRVGDIEHYIQDGVNGYLSNPNDIENFRDKLDFIVKNYDNATAVGKKGKDLVYSAFNYRDQTRKVLAIIRNI